MNNGQSYISFSIPCVLLWQCEVATLENNNNKKKHLTNALYVQCKGKSLNFGLEDRKKYAVIY